MPWILTVSPRSLAAGGVEVTERATGERSTRPIEDVEALIRGEGLPAHGLTMPPRPMLPVDDLYARLELPVEASYEAVEIAWRALLKRHHPDVAGVARRRPREADQRRPRLAVGSRSCAPATTPSGIRLAAGGPQSGGRASAAPRRRAARPPAPRRPLEPAEAVERHLARVRRLSQDELDRLSLAESPPIAFVASISRFLSADQLAAVEGLGARVAGRAAAEGPLGRPDPRRRPRLRPRAVARPVPRRTPVGAVPRARPGAPRPRLGVGDRPAALRPEQRRRPRSHRAAANAGPGGPERAVCRVGAVGGAAGRAAMAARPLGRGRRRAPGLVAARPARCRGRAAGVRARRSPGGRSVGRCTASSSVTPSSPPSWLDSPGPWSDVLPAPASPTRPTAKRA